MSTTAGESTGTATGEIVLFGVRMVVDSMRKSVSLNNLYQYVHPQEHHIAGSAADKDAATGYASADDAVHHRSSSPSANAGNRDRKRGVPWTEEEHKLFLLGLQKVGKGDWRGISRNFVKTRTPTQVASHAQKYFLRRSNLNRRRRRSSLFDITTDTVSATPAEDQHVNKNVMSSQSPQAKSAQGTSSAIPVVRFSASPTHPISANPMVSPAQVDQIMSEKVLVVQDYMSWNTTNNINHHQMGLMTPLPLSPAATEHDLDLDLNNNSMNVDSSPLSLNLSLSLPSDGSNLSRQSPFHSMPSFFNGDSMISVG